MSAPAPALPPAAAALVAKYALQPHPEGGFFRETFRSPQSLTRSKDGAQRSCATSILYLLAAGDRSLLHRIQSDELWYHHAGGGLEVCELTPPEHSGADAAARVTLLAPGDSAEGAGAGVVFLAVPAHTYFGARCSAANAEGFALVSCVVAPGFDFADWEMEGAAALRAAFPGAAAARLIDELGKQDA